MDKRKIYLKLLLDLMLLVCHRDRLPDRLVPGLALSPQAGKKTINIKARHS